MIEVEGFYKELVKNKINFFTGVPDSLLKDICAYVSENVAASSHVIGANEGSSLGLAVGYHLATNSIPLVYMQNSGFGNIINPLTSLADPEVYSIPMILLIGWRGEPGVKDEPQHVKQGRVSEKLLESLEIPYSILDSNSNWKEHLLKGISIANCEKRPYAFLVRKNAFSSYKLKSTNPFYELNREDAVKLIINELGDQDIVVSTTGKTSREVFEYREQKGMGHQKDFLTVGAMGHASQIAMGIALQKRERTVVCIDGDGAAIMHLGALTTNGVLNPKNYKHIVINNGAHDSVGGQPTVAFSASLSDIAKASGYGYVKCVHKVPDIKKSLKEVLVSKTAAFLEIKVNKGARENLGRPTTTPIENKLSFEDFVRNESSRKI